MAHMTKDPSNPARFVVLYPAYINARLTVQEGRRIAKELAVENPTPREILTILLKLQAEKGLTIKFEGNKHYSRDYLQVGRARVQLKNSDGSAICPDIQTRKQLWCYVAQQIKNIPERKVELRLGELEPQVDAPTEETAANKGKTNAKPKPSGKPAKANSKGKKGKKK
ncbi:uncharacterized protein MONBRDRAFT_28897 [Monosiga brevicollis MX1]|uniref:Signal recognition particle 19 kDa protein n=1 Tax=Monosiga brevicollis TaxID=81824 RepID=A9V9D7_MONBE|nr:uncharacterized protein MONBRDRAFT_28897 [Monosiga brevicollis MX1]EDQ85912.1 predicted protein [Monosiga brevicollis MX1]|eukprot:XP_001749391.1 hypothetical protein [Monosiga brevicollis MX1]